MSDARLAYDEIVRPKVERIRARLDNILTDLDKNSRSFPDPRAVYYELVLGVRELRGVMLAMRMRGLVSCNPLSEGHVQENGE